MKTGIIVVLTLSTILLLCFFWSDATFEDISNYIEPEIEVTPVTEVIVPDAITVSFGGDAYAILPVNETAIWNGVLPEERSIIGEFRSFSKAGDIAVEEITKEQYQEVMSYKSIKADFLYALDFRGLCNAYNIKWANSYEGISALTSIGYSEYSKECMFICDESKGKYYRLLSAKDNTEFTALLSEIKLSPFDTYYPLGTFLGIKNDVLIPLVLNKDLAEFTYQQEFYPTETEKINKIAQSFFGTSLEFIRKITEESGTITYMYGYGEKVLILNTDGNLEYKEEFKGENYVGQKQFEALQTALEYIANHGKWSLSGDTEMRPYLKNVESTPGNQNGYTFTFGMEVHGGRFLDTDDEGITITVVGGQVIHYKRNLFTMNSSGKSEVIQPLSAINMLTQNYTYIYEATSKNQETDTALDEATYTFENTAETIENLQVGYLVKRERGEPEGQAIPVWMVTVGDSNIYFDLYTNEPIE